MAYGTLNTPANLAKASLPTFKAEIQHHAKQLGKIESASGEPTLIVASVVNATRVYLETLADALLDRFTETSRRDEYRTNARLLAAEATKWAKFGVELEESIISHVHANDPALRSENSLHAETIELLETEPMLRDNYAPGSLNGPHVHTFGCNDICEALGCIAERDGVELGEMFAACIQPRAVHIEVTERFLLHVIGYLWDGSKGSYDYPCDKVPTLREAERIAGDFQHLTGARVDIVRTRSVWREMRSNPGTFKFRSETHSYRRARVIS